MPEGSLLIQDVDDVLISSGTTESCLAATTRVLLKLWETGYRVSRKKLQCCRPRVQFLGRIVTGGLTGISPLHRTTILHHPKPDTVKDMLSFLGLTGYSRHYVPDYVGMTQPLRDMVRQLGMRNLPAKLKWTAEAERHFIKLKQALAQAVDLAVPD
ncbi:uncharacterized protein LOC143516409 [Brachyhypopomus gauderio]|uniref:uncharacterized protein LOC143516409 n=1 Tax=Brachyhypopomus gauderio TaxID=698409 RepID=UPI004042731C